MPTPRTSLYCIRIHDVHHWGEPERAPQLGDQRRFCLFVTVRLTVYFYLRIEFVLVAFGFTNIVVALSCMYKQLYTLHTAQCTVHIVHVSGTTTWIRPARSAYGGGESGRETNVPLKHLNAEKNG